MKNINVAVIGCGVIFPIHADAVSSIEGLTLSAVCDIDPTKRDACAARYNAEAFADYREILECKHIHAVHITTPHYLHREMAINAMKAGKSVICEKPAAITAGDADEMKRVASETGMMLGICFQNRYNSTSVKMKEIIDSGSMGAILGSNASVTWYKDEAYYKSGAWRGRWDTEGGGVLINQSIHTLDLQVVMTGLPDKLKGVAYTSVLNDFIEVEDTAVATFVYKDSNKRGNFYATNACAVNAPIRLEVFTENGTLILGNDLTVNFNDGRIERYEEIDSGTGEKAYWGTGHKLYIADFYKRYRSGLPPAVGIDAGINTLKILEAIYRSGKSGNFEII